MKFQVWKTVTLGVYKSARIYYEAFRRLDLYVTSWAREILYKIHVSQLQIQLELAVVLVASLGFDKATRYDIICAKAKELGLELCPAEVGPALRLTYLDRSFGESMYIAMEGIISSSGHCGLFEIIHRDDTELDEGPSLSCYNGSAKGLYNPGDRLVFVLPHK